MALEFACSASNWAFGADPTSAKAKVVYVACRTSLATPSPRSTRKLIALGVAIDVRQATESLSRPQNITRHFNLINFNN